MWYLFLPGWKQGLSPGGETNHCTDVHTPNQKIATRFPLITFQSADADQDRMLGYINFYIYPQPRIFRVKKNLVSSSSVTLRTTKVMQSQQTERLNSSRTQGRHHRFDFGHCFS